MAQRISLLYGINAPEFLINRYFALFINELLQQGLLENNGGNLSYTDELDQLSDTLEQLLDGSLRQSILNSLKKACTFALV